MTIDGFAHDECLSIFSDVYDTGALVFPPNARVLEIGCAEADWMGPVLDARPDLTIVGIDWRACERRGEVIRGDVLTYDFPRRSFDVVVGISSIEHIGLGHYEGDPLDPDGDRHCMERVVRWLKPGGWVYADVPYGPEYRVEGTSHRVYDDAALASRLLVPGLVPTGSWWSQPRGGMSSVKRMGEGGEMVYVAVVAMKES